MPLPAVWSVCTLPSPCCTAVCTSDITRIPSVSRHIFFRVQFFLFSVQEEDALIQQAHDHVVALRKAAVGLSSGSEDVGVVDDVDALAV
jgi:hypothetical protein